MGIGVLTLLLLSVFTSWSLYYNVTIGLLVFTFLSFVDALGKKIPIGEFLSFSGVAFWLATPIPIKQIYKYTALAVNEDMYYSYALPATIAMIIGLHIPLSKHKIDFSILVNRLENYLAQPKNQKLQWILLSIGVVGGLAYNYIPIGIAFFVFLLSQLIYVASLYSIFTPSLSKTLIIVSTLGITLIIVILTGMFGQLIWWALCALMIIALKYKFNMTQKLIAVALGIVFVTGVQQIKHGFRRKTRATSVYVSVDRTEVFGQEVSRSFSSGSVLSKESFGFILVRSNQAFLSSLVMRHVPARQEHTNGKTLFNSMFAGFVPRFLWPNKPKSGGKENMERFAGIKLTRVSMDIGNIMDGYIDFGRIGGIIYMFMYGMLINYMLGLLLGQYQRFSPTIILWAPFVFIQVLKVETSFDTTFNSAIKGLFFVWLIFLVFNRFFNVRL